MTEKYEIVAVDTDSEKDHDFTVKFDRRYSLHEGFPITENAYVQAVDKAYDWFPTTEMHMELDEGQRVGWVVVDDERELVEIVYEPEE